MTTWQGPPAADRKPNLTEVEIAFVAGRMEHVCLFGRPIEERKIDETRSILYFAPGDVFGLARWMATGFGATVSRLDILRAIAPGQSYVALPFVRPGAEALLRLDGSNKVQCGLQVIEQICATGIDPADAAPDYWLHVGNRIAAHQQVRPYTRVRHAVWKLRQRIAP
jgi:hypothetical protein